MQVLQISLIIITQSIAYFYLCVRGKKQDLENRRMIRNYVLSLCLTILFAWVAKRATTNLLSYTRLLTLYQILYCIAVVDAQTKLIPNILLVFGGLFQILFLGIEWVINDCSLKNILFPAIVGGIVSFGILFVIYLISRQAIGFGDVKLIGLIGFFSDYLRSLSVLFFALIFATIYAIYLLCCKKYSKEEPFAFAPFIFCGYCFYIFLLG